MAVVVAEVVEAVYAVLRPLCRVQEHSLKGVQRLEVVEEHTGGVAGVQGSADGRVAAGCTVVEEEPWVDGVVLPGTAEAAAHMPGEQLRMAVVVAAVQG
jgi:hypothetical protein